MKKEVQNLIKDLQDKKEKALATSIRCRTGKDINGAKQKEERAKAFSFCIQELTKILNKKSANANTDKNSIDNKDQGGMYW